MWRDLDEPTLAWRQRCLAFAKTEIAPRRDRYDKENVFPAEVHDAAREAGLLNVDIPQALGGAGISDVASVVGVEALASVCAPTAFSLGFNRGALRPVFCAGTPDQQQEFVGRLVREGRYASLCLTEPDNSGSNLLGLATTAKKTDRGWVISGEKVMVGNGTASSQYQVLARTEVDGVFKGLTFFVVPRTENVSVGPNTDKLGFRCVETPSIRFDQVEISDDHRLGPIGSGATVVVDTLNTIRVGGSATILGIAVGALQDALPWVEERAVYGGKLANKSHVQLLLGGFYARLASVRHTIQDAAQRREQGRPFGEQASIAKLHAAELAQDVTAAVVQLFGWRGIDARFPIQKRYRDARQTSIFEGTSETQKLSLFRSLQDRYRNHGDL